LAAVILTCESHDANRPGKVAIVGEVAEIEMLVDTPGGLLKPGGLIVPGLVAVGIGKGDHIVGVLGQDAY